MLRSSTFELNSFDALRQMRGATSEVSKCLAAACRERGRSFAALCREKGGPLVAACRERGRSLAGKAEGSMPTAAVLGGGLAGCFCAGVCLCYWCLHLV